jgi:hypothetical protein
MADLEVRCHQPADADAAKFYDRVADRVEHLADLLVVTLVQGDLVPTVLVRRF